MKFLKSLTISFAFLSSLTFARLPTFKDVKNAYVSSDRVLLDKDGEWLQDLRSDYKVRKLRWTSISELPPFFVDAVLRAEDRRFYSHPGVDFKALIRGAWKSLRSRHLQGGSTITMQVASLIESNETRKSSRGARRNFFQKIRQMYRALLLERSWQKAEILEAYFNLLSFRGELVGVGAASAGIFAKEVHGLNREEAFLLASLIRSPNAAPELWSKRACALAQYFDAAETSCENLKFLVAELSVRPLLALPSLRLAPFVARTLASQNSGTGPLRSTLDRDLQQFATELLRRSIGNLKSKHVGDGAMLVVEHATGNVLAYVGNTGADASSPHVDGVRAYRQAGSTLKPFLYAHAIERRILTQRTLLDDSSVDIPVTGGVYRPRNFDHRFHGPVEVRMALASSLNVPAVKTLLMVGVSDYLDTLASLSFTHLEDANFYGPSLALGAVDVRLWDMVQAYSILARGGESVSLSVDASRSTNHLLSARIFSPETSYILGEILSRRENRILTFGLDSPLATPFWTVVKTGTSKDMRDNWCVGYSRDYTVGVWVGNFRGSPMWNVSGTTGAAPIWLRMMKKLSEYKASPPPEAPTGIVFGKDEIQDQSFAFLEGTVFVPKLLTQKERAPRIAYPSDGAIFALDPDIPLKNQRIFFEAVEASKQYSWRLNNEDLGPAQNSTGWTLRRGDFRLSLVERGQKNAQSEVHFLVK